MQYRIVVSKKEGYSAEVMRETDTIVHQTANYANRTGAVQSAVEWLRDVEQPIRPEDLNYTTEDR